MGIPIGEIDLLLLVLGQPVLGRPHFITQCLEMLEFLRKSRRRRSIIRFILGFQVRNGCFSSFQQAL